MPKHVVTNFVSNLSFIRNMCMSILKFYHDVTIQLQDYSSHYQKLFLCIQYSEKKIYIINY